MLELKTNAELDEALRQHRVVIVDFWATWCMPCRMTAPHFEAASQTLGDKVLFAKVNVDEAGELAMRYRVHSIPTLLIFKDNGEAQRLVGACDQQEIEEALKEWIE